jgi:anti-anti-sigma factor
MQQPAELKEVEGVPIVEMFGEADLANMAELQACLSSAERTQTRSVIVSLMHAEYFDSSTIHALVTFGDQLKTAGRRLLVVGPSGESGRRILTIFGLSGKAPVFDTLPDALASARSASGELSPNGPSIS